MPKDQVKIYAPEDPEREHRTRTLTAELKDQTDRGVVIVAASFVEEALAMALASCLHDDSKHAWEQVFREGGVLGSFAAKIHMARVMGMMSSAVCADLHTIREIRNDFAHLYADKLDHSQLSLESQKYKERCLALNTLSPRKFETGRHAFTHACIVLHIDFSQVAMWKSKIDVGCVWTPSESPRPNLLLGSLVAKKPPETE